MSDRVLVGWMNSDDLKGRPALGPALKAATARFDRVVLLNNLPAAAVNDWLATLAITLPIALRDAQLKSPVDYAEIHRAAVDALSELREAHGGTAQFSFLLSSGTPPMGAVWLLLAKSRFEATLVAWSSHTGQLEDIDVPFDISAEFIPRLVSPALGKMFGAQSATAEGFERVIGSSEVMRHLVQRARHVARYDLPVVLEGESGTGKELLARAIHDTSPRRRGPFIAVNCGAIPPTLVESELFGHARGAFTGAERDRPGHFRRAHGGTLFLDEIGELPLAIQTLLLRPLQEKEVLPVGASEPARVDVRLIAASHRRLPELVSGGEFREDLYFRLAVATLRLPPLRERAGDLGLLIDSLWSDLERKQRDLRLPEKRLMPAARRKLLTHSWRGNVRELGNVLARLMLWAEEDVGAGDVDEALGVGPRATSSSVLDRPLREGFDLHAVQAEVARHYLARALDQTHGNKSKAAELLGLKSQQVLTDWMKRHRVELPTSGRGAD